MLHFTDQQCKPLTEVRAQITEAPVHSGSKIEIYAHESNCNHPTNNQYVLLHENHSTGELDVILQQQNNKFTILNLQLNISGIYCAYKQCAPEQKEQCCTRIIGQSNINLQLRYYVLILQFHQRWK